MCLLHNLVDKDNNLKEKESFYLLTLFVQVKKEYQEKLFAHFQLSERIPMENFSKSVKTDAKAMQRFCCLLKHLLKPYMVNFEGL